jgi:AbrB family looped-hinge helix DNA binding protein
MCYSRKYVIRGGDTMHSRIAPVSVKGQVTIPAEIRKELGITTPDQVEFVLRDDGVVELRAPAMTLDEVFGSVPPLPHETDDLDEEIAEAIALAYARPDRTPE